MGRHGVCTVIAGLLLALLPAAAAGAAEAPPEVQATSYVLVDPRTGEELAARSAGMRMPMASTTKLMTAIVALQRADPQDALAVPPEAVIGGSTAGLVAGERLAVRDLLTALLVGSGNDSAITLAAGVAGGQARFVDLMNARARQLGLDDTRFANPHGLDEPGHYSTARDLVVLGRAAMQRARIRKRVDQRRATIPGPDGVGTRTLVSKNDLLDIDPSADGIKTGFTEGAGNAIVARATRRGVGSLYLALLGSPTEQQRAADAKRLLDWGFRQFAYGALVVGGRPQAEVQVTGSGGRSVTLVAPDSLIAAVKADAPVTRRIVAPPAVRAPVARGQRLGRVEFRQGGRLIGRRPLVAARAVDSASPWDRLRFGLSRVLPF
jgi:D-alanyl-D-alanine carboxypeptidase (penicillin-binding protein 5/6)